MSILVRIQSSQGLFEAAIVGAPDVRATTTTREEALAALETIIAKKLDHGELVEMEVPRLGLMGLFGKFRDDPTLRQICEEAYDERAKDTFRTGLGDNT